MSGRTTGAPTRDRTGGGPARVSDGLTERFAARVRRRRWRRAAVAAAVVAVLAGAGWVVLRSPWLAVRTVLVTGTHRLDARAVQALLAGQLGRPMLLIDPGTIRARVRSLQLVADASVARSWPDTLTVVVRERTPVAAVPAPGGVRLEDAEGVDLGVLPGPPPGVPVVQVDLARAGAAALRTAVQVVTGLPAALRAQTRAAGADSPDAAWLLLRDGTRVEWGSADGSDAKVAALAAVGARGAGVVVDVSAPQSPAVRRTP